MNRPIRTPTMQSPVGNTAIRSPMESISAGEGYPLPQVLTVTHVQYVNTFTFRGFDTALAEGSCTPDLFTSAADGSVLRMYRLGVIEFGTLGVALTLEGGGMPADIAGHFDNLFIDVGVGFNSLESSMVRGIVSGTLNYTLSGQGALYTALGTSGTSDVTVS